MAAERVIDTVGRGIGLVDADGEGWVGLKPADQGVGKAAIVVEQDADRPGADFAEIDRSEGVDGDQRRWPSIGHTVREKRVDCGMVGYVDVGETSRALCLAQAPIGRHWAALAFSDDETGGICRTVAVDDEA